MKRFLPLFIIALTLCSCESNKPSYISVANKTFYKERSDAVNPFYFAFTKDSVFYRAPGTYTDKGIFRQEDEVVIMNLEKNRRAQHAIVVKDILLCEAGIFTLEAPNF